MRQANTTVLSFAERLELVNAEIIRRSEGVAREYRTAFISRLWCGWLRREVLS